MARSDRAAITADDPTPTLDEVVRRVRDLEPGDRRRLGRWTSASLRDPRLGRGIELARQRSLELLDADPGRRKRWEIASRPLFDGLAAARGEVRRWRGVMLVSHLVAVVAIARIPAGLAPSIALAISILAPLSAWAAWGRGTAWIGAIHAGLADALGDRLEPDHASRLRAAWVNAIEHNPPLPPPRIGVIGAFAPSVLLVIACVAVSVVVAGR